mgnify:CR=1 FL=1
MFDATVDLIANGQAQGDVANQLMSNGRLNTGSLRPFIGDDAELGRWLYRKNAYPNT